MRSGRGGPRATARACQIARERPDGTADEEEARGSPEQGHPNGAPKAPRDAGRPSYPGARCLRSSTERSKTAGGAPSNGCTKGNGGSIHSRPCAASGIERKKGEAAAIGCTAEQASCRNPGCVSSRDRVPPPMVSFASRTSTESPERSTPGHSPWNSPHNPFACRFPSKSNVNGRDATRRGCPCRGNESCGRPRLPRRHATPRRSAANCASCTPLEE